MRKIYFALTLPLFIAITACGFHLRNTGFETLPPLTVMSSDPNNPLFLNLKPYLTEHDPNLILKLDEKPLNKTVLATNTTGQPVQYLLTYQLEYSVSRQDGTIIIPASLFTLQRNFNTSPNLMLGQDTETALMVNEMRQQALQALLKRLNKIPK